MNSASTPRHAVSNHSGTSGYSITVFSREVAATFTTIGMLYKT
jgi:hypothetical protein